MLFLKRSIRVVTAILALAMLSGCVATGPGIRGAQNPVTIQHDPYYGKEWQSAAEGVVMMAPHLNKNYNAESARAGQALVGWGRLLDVMSR